MELTLKGARYTVYFRMEVKEDTFRYRGDTGHRHKKFGEGEITVRNESGECLAACRLGYSDWGPPGHQHRPVNDEVFARCIDMPDLLAHKREEYADWLAEEWIKRFRADRKQGIPRFALEAPATEALIQRGFIADELGQTTLGLVTA